MTQTIKVTPVDCLTAVTIDKVDLSKAKIRFLDYTNPDFRVYFQDETTVIIEGGSGEINLEIYLS